MQKNLGMMILLALVIAPIGFLARAEVDRPDASAIRLPQGYKAELAIAGLSVPTTAIVDGDDIIVAESGFAKTARPRVLRISSNGKVDVMVEKGLEPPVTGLLLHAGKLYVSHKGKVSVVEDGELKDIVTDLPSEGDHQNNQIVMGPDGRIYMGQGTVTNAGVVGPDNYVFGWLEQNKKLREIPCRDITLKGENFTGENPLTKENDRTTTGAYKPFGQRSTAGETISGNVKCGGSIVSFLPDGSDFRLVAWGLRNPFGLEFDQAGQLWATSHGADVRGSRNIAGDPDYLVKVQQDAWYGWPDYFNGKPATDQQFHAFGRAKPNLLWSGHPQLTRAFTIFESHGAANGLAISASDAFGFSGQAFVALFGTLAPVTTGGTNVKPAGFSVMRVNLQNGRVEPFASNKIPGPNYLNRQGGFNRPSDIVFAKDGSMLVVDWGGANVSAQGLEFTPETGVIWRIYKDGQAALHGEGPVVVPAAPMPASARQTAVKNAWETFVMIWPLLLAVGVLVVTALGIVLLLFKRSA